MSQRPLFSILHTSARPDAWRKVYDDWMEKAEYLEYVEYVLCVDPRWGFEPVGRVKYEDRGALNVVVQNHGRRCYVDGVNTAAKASHGHILIVNADDQFACENWDTKLTEAIAEAGFGSFTSETKPFVIEVSTGTPTEHERGILVMPILSRARYEQQGSEVFYHGYESMWADADFCQHARADAVVIDARHLPVFPHRHEMFDAFGGWSKKNYKNLDAAYQAQMRPEAYRLGETILKWRQRVGYGKELAHAETIEGWMFPEELECLSLWASQMDTIVEIGSWKGRSTYAICKGTAGHVTAVDTFKGSIDEPDHQARVAAAGGSTLGEFDANTKDCTNLSTLEMDSLEAAALCENADMVFIDGGHSYEQVLADLKAWAPKAKKLLCGHDADHPPVAQALREVLGEVERGDGGLWFKPANAAGQVVAKRNIALCLSGEQFQGAWVDSLLTLYSHLIELDFGVARMRAYTSNVYLTREECRQAVMSADPKPDLVLWLDDDNLVTPEQFDRLLADLDSRPEVDGVTAWSWIHDQNKQGFIVSCGEWAPDRLHWKPFPGRTFPKETALRPIEVSGFPCFLMRYSALEKAGPRCFRPILDDALEHGMTGEDISFCRAAEDGGAKFLVDPQVRVPHLKYVEANPVYEDEGAPEPVRVACMMRVKNEGRWLGRVIDSVKPLCGENIFVMEDGSSDDTVEVIDNAGAQLLPSPFVGQGLDEGRDKNWLLQQVIERCHPDWILMPDGDEELEPGGGEKIRRVLEHNPPVDCFLLRFLYLWDSLDTARFDGVYGKGARQSLFRCVPNMGFKSMYSSNADNPNHVGLHVSNSPYGLRQSPLNVFLLHYGYLFKEDRIRKYEWITKLDPHNEEEDHYRHMVQGDIPEVPADLVLKHAGPLKLQKIPERMVPKFDHEIGPFGVRPHTGTHPLTETTFGVRPHTGTHPLTETTCDDGSCWCHVAHATPRKVVSGVYRCSECGAVLFNGLARCEECARAALLDLGDAPCPPLPVPVPVPRYSHHPIRSKLNLGCCDRRIQGFVGVDLAPGPAVDVVADLSKPWPWADGSVEEIVAHDVIEHLPDRLLTMNETWRVLKPGGKVDIVVPTTDGPGAFQDPTHVSFWHRNSFKYFEAGNPYRERFAQSYGIQARFRVVAEKESRTQDGPKLSITLEKVA